MTSSYWNSRLSEFCIFKIYIFAVDMQEGTFSTDTIHHKQVKSIIFWWIRPRCARSCDRALLYPSSLLGTASQCPPNPCLRSSRPLHLLFSPAPLSSSTRTEYLWPTMFSFCSRQSTPCSSRQDWRLFPKTCLYRRTWKGCIFASFWCGSLWRDNFLIIRIVFRIVSMEYCCSYS